MATSTRRSPAISIICVLLAIVCAIGAIFYWTQSTSFLAGGTPGIHHKHAAIFAALTVVFLLGAIAFRPRRSALR